MSHKAIVDPADYPSIFSPAKEPVLPAKRVRLEFGEKKEHHTVTVVPETLVIEMLAAAHLPTDGTATMIGPLGEVLSKSDLAYEHFKDGGIAKVVVPPTPSAVPTKPVIGGR